MGRMKKYQTEEERIEAKKKREKEYYEKNKLKRSQYYKDRYKQMKESNSLPTSQTTKPNVTVYNTPTEEIEEEVWIEPIEDDSASHYTGPII